ncbi:AMP-binding protein [Streptococcus mutans]|uniref:AMP-binding protein n=1 Tax=Streptococcus mutans TaxID=1309 RepID=UPI002741FCDC|nr:AMP-binding protein [Streptococcus mutans]MDP5872883.1 AMP-binding protein [Streptococcus mutans]
MEYSFYDLVFRFNDQPKKLAIETDNSSITYEELFNKVKDYSKKIEQVGLLPGSKVIVHMRRSPEYIITILSLSKLEITFIPVDITYPKERIDFIKNDCQANGIITDYKYDDLTVVDYLKVDGNANLIFNCFGKKDNDSNEKIAYIIYTSGSTGKPKGVQISNKGFSYLKELFNENLKLGKDDKILQFASTSFDASIWEISMALMNGLTLALFLDSDKDKNAFEVFVKEHSVTVATLPPSYSELLSKEVISKFNLLITAGSEPHKKLLKKINLEETRYVNAYGPTECTVCACLWEAKDLKELDSNQIPIGNINQDNLLIDDSGELCVSGKGLSVGYLNRDILNQKSYFYLNGLRYYKTGDLVSTDKQGNIYFRGRNDNQVKFNGYRIELEEIERSLFDIAPSIIDAAVSVINKTLVCFYVGNIDVSEVRKELENRLPFYMVPSLFQQVESFVYNTSGKIDRNKLTIKNEEQHFESSDNKLDSKLEEILNEILPVEVNNRDESLMEYGLNSLGLINLAAKVKSVFGIDISIEEISKNCTFNGLISILSLKNKKSKFIKNDEITHDVENENEWFPLTNIQESYLLGRNNFSEMGGYGTHGYFEVKTKLDPVRLSKALNKVISSQGMLRAVFSEDLQQRILPDTLKYQIDISDMSSSTQEEIDKEIKRRRDKLSHQVFDYTKWPLFDISALCISEKYTILFISIDGLLADAKSMKIFASQWLEAYNGADTSKLAPRISFRDYIINTNGDSKNKENAKAFWLKKLDKLPESPHIIDEDAKAEVKNIFSRESLFLNEKCWGLIKEFCHNNHITQTAFFIQIYFETLRRWSQNKEFTINLSVFNRKNIHEDIDNLIGDFTSNLFLDNRNQGVEDSFVEKVTSLQDDLFLAIDNISFDGIDFLRAYTNKYKKNLIVPYVVTSLISEEKTKQAADYLGEMTYGISQTPQVYIDMQISNSHEGILINWDYSNQKFTKEFMLKLIEVFEKNITSVLNDKKDIDSELPVGDQVIIENYNNTTVEYDSCRLEQLFFNTAENFPTQIAIKDKDCSYTYAQLKKEVIQRSSNIAQTVGKKGQKIGIIDERNCQTIIDLISILYSGNTYVPIEKDCPPDRLAYIKSVAEIEYLINDIDKMKQLEKVDGINDEEQVAYVIFTSGSTGKPKGVAVSHRSAVNTIIDINKRFKLNSNDHFMLLSSLSFDLSVFDIFGSLAIGGSLYIVDDRRDLEEINNIIKHEKITVWNSVPSTMKAYLNYSNNEIFNVGKIVDELRNLTSLNSLIDENIVFSKEANDKYKSNSTSRFVISNYNKKINLPSSNNFPDFILSRKSTRHFSEKDLISMDKFMKVISSLGKVKDNNSTHYLYPSAGGLYPIDIYISVENKKIEGISGGIYYYNPIANTIYKIYNSPLESNVHYYSNQKISEHSSFTILLVYNSEANIRKYGSDGYKYALIDSGYLGQHVTTVANINGISSCVIGAADSELITKRLSLSPNQMFLNCIIFGRETNQLNYELNETKVQNISLLENSLNIISDRVGSLRVIMLSGDYIPLDLPYKIFDRFGEKVALYSLGGATECSIWSIYYPISKVETKWKTIPYGYPLGNQKIWIMDEKLNICPVDVFGEIVIGGVGVGEEYLNNPIKTAESFVNHSQLGKVYRTGDFGILRKNGTIEFMGRLDNQVKINGYRVELPEIEKVIKDNCDIQDVVAIIDSTESGTNKLICFVQSEIKSNLYEYIVERIKNELPVYMIPQEIHKVEKIPVTENGKVDKKKLLADSMSYKKNNSESAGNLLSEGQLDEAEKGYDENLLLEIQQIFSSILDVNDFSNDSTIFELGGDSINIVSIQKQIEKKYGVNLKIIDVFENNTVNKLVNFLESKNKIKIIGARFTSSFLTNKSGDETVEETVKLVKQSEFRIVFEALVLILLDVITNTRFDILYDCDKNNSEKTKIIRFSKEYLKLDRVNLDATFSKLIGQSKFETLLNLTSDGGTTISYTNLMEPYKHSKADLVFYFNEEKSELKAKFNSCKLKDSRIKVLLDNVAKVSESLN